MTDHKPLDQLVSELEQHRRLVGKNFIHTKSGQRYQLLTLAHTADTNDLVAVYCLSAMSRLKFTLPIAEFVEGFEEGI